MHRDYGTLSHNAPWRWHPDSQCTMTMAPRLTMHHDDGTPIHNAPWLRHADSQCTMTMAPRLTMHQDYDTPTHNAPWRWHPDSQYTMTMAPRFTMHQDYGTPTHNAPWQQPPDSQYGAAAGLAWRQNAVGCPVDQNEEDEERGEDPAREFVHPSGFDARPRQGLGGVHSHPLSTQAPPSACHQIGHVLFMYFNHPSQGISTLTKAR